MSVIHPETIEDYNYDKQFGIVVVKLSADWCWPCKQIEPYFNELAENNPDITFISVDIDMLKEHEDTSDIKTIPMFKAFIDGTRLSKHYKGTEENKLESYINWVINQNKSE